MRWTTLWIVGVAALMSGCFYHDGYELRRSGYPYYGSSYYAYGYGHRHGYAYGHRHHGSHRRHRHRCDGHDCYGRRPHHGKPPDHDGHARRPPANHGKPRDHDGHVRRPPTNHGKPRDHDGHAQRPPTRRGKPRDHNARAHRPRHHGRPLGFVPRFGRHAPRSGRMGGHTSTPSRMHRRSTSGGKGGRLK